MAPGTPGKFSWSLRRGMIRQSRPLLALACLLGVGFALMAVPGYTHKAAATLTTDKSDYSPGQTAILSGTGWQAGETVNIAITAANHEEEDLSATADDGGNITAQFAVDADDI